MEHFTPLSALAGGALIGTSASMLLWANGRVAGISGILGEFLQPRKGELGWRAAFLIGLLVGGIALRWTSPEVFVPHPDRSFAAVALAGVLVGFGTRMGNGCTSGHGVCGIPRGSTRSMVATITFIFTGAVTVWVTNTLFGASL